MINPGFFQIFDNYPNIDMSSKTNKLYIMEKFNEHPANVMNLLNEALDAQYIEPIIRNEGLGTVKYKQEYRITQKAYQLYLQCEDI